MNPNDWNERAVAALSASQAVIELALEHEEMSPTCLRAILRQGKNVIADAEGAAHTAA